MGCEPEALPISEERPIFASQSRRVETSLLESLGFLSDLDPMVIAIPCSDNTRRRERQGVTGLALSHRISELQPWLTSVGITVATIAARC